ncbi:hypothetical protein UMZ34_07290 [Halopseudomonas pachastrellae]|nr:hypothetical protein UMZ34_07290 [Halopseudomonas pachastrellae]
MGMEEEILPHRSSIEADSVEEERRLAYVASPAPAKPWPSPLPPSAGSLVKSSTAPQPLSG